MCLQLAKGEACGKRKRKEDTEDNKEMPGNLDSKWRSRVHKNRRLVAVYNIQENIFRKYVCTFTALLLLLIPPH